MINDRDSVKNALNASNVDVFCIFNGATTRATRSVGRSVAVSHCAATATATTTAPSASKPPPPRPGSARSDGESLAKLRQFIDRPSSASRRTANGGGDANGGDEKRSPAPSPAKSQMLRGLASRAERRQTAPP